MSEREDFNAWLETWALPGNTSREDAMYAAWQARAARTASGLRMPDAQKLADLLISQVWVEVDCQEGYDEFVTSLGCNLYDPAVQPVPGDEDVVLSAARTAPAEPVAIANKGRGAFWVKWTDAAKDLFGPDIKLYTAPDALQAEVERLREEVEQLKANAERYLWLRRKNRNNIVVRNGVSHLFDELLDRSIDAARTAKPEVNHE